MAVAPIGSPPLALTWLGGPVANPVNLPDGSAAIPALSFSSNPDMGLYSAGVSTLGFATAGVGRWQIDANGHWIPVADNAYDVGGTVNRVRNLYVAGTASVAALTAAGLITANAGITVASGQTLALAGATVSGQPTWSSTQSMNISGNAAGSAGSVAASALTGTTMAANVVTSSLTTIGTLVAGAVPASLVTTGTFPGVYTITGALTLSAALTYGGVTLSNAVTGTGNMVLSAGPTLTGTVVLTGTTITGAPTWSSTQTLVTSGSAATLTTSRSLWGQSFNGSASVSGSLSNVTSINMTSTLTNTGGAAVISSTSGSAQITLDCHAGSGATTAYKLDGSAAKWLVGFQVVAVGSWDIYDNLNGATAISITPGANPSVAFNGALSGITTLAGTGAVSGFTTYGGVTMASGAVSTVTTLDMSSDLTGLGFKALVKSVKATNVASSGTTSLTVCKTAATGSHGFLVITGKKNGDVNTRTSRAYWVAKSPASGAGTATQLGTDVNGPSAAVNFAVSMSGTTDLLITNNEAFGVDFIMDWRGGDWG